MRNVVVFTFLLVSCNHFRATRVYLQDDQGNSNMTNRWFSNNNKWLFRTEKETPYFSICFSKNSVLSTTRYEIPVNASVIYGKVTITGQLCDKLNDAILGPIDNCTNGISISYESRSKDGGINLVTNATDFPNKYPPPVHNSTMYETSEFFLISTLTGGDLLQIRFNSLNFCGSLHNFKLYYIVCSSNGNLVHYPVTPAPSFNVVVTRVEGSCSANSVPENPGEQLWKECSSLGTETFHGKCLCDVGYAFEKEENSCKGTCRFYCFLFFC